MTASQSNGLPLAERKQFERPGGGWVLNRIGEADRSLTVAAL